MGVLLTFVGLILLLPALLGVALGSYIATNPRMRIPGVMFALWWVPAAAAAAGILMRDPVTATIGGGCWVIAGAALILGGHLDLTNLPGSRPRSQTPEEPEPPAAETEPEAAALTGENTTDEMATRQDPPTPQSAPNEDREPRRSGRQGGNNRKGPRSNRRYGDRRRAS